MLCSSTGTVLRDLFVVYRKLLRQKKREGEKLRGRPQWVELVHSFGFFGIKAGISGWNSCTALVFADTNIENKVGNRNLLLGEPTRLLSILGLLSGDRALRPMIKAERSVEGGFSGWNSSTALVLANIGIKVGNSW